MSSSPPTSSLFPQRRITIATIRRLYKTRLQRLHPRLGRPYGVVLPLGSQLLSWLDYHHRRTLRTPTDRVPTPTTPLATNAYSIATAEIQAPLAMAEAHRRHPLHIQRSQRLQNQHRAPHLSHTHSRISASEK